MNYLFALYTLVGCSTKLFNCLGCFGWENNVIYVSFAYAADLPFPLHVFAERKFNISSISRKIHIGFITYALSVIHNVHVYDGSFRKTLRRYQWTTHGYMLHATQRRKQFYINLASDKKESKQQYVVCFQ